MQRARSTLNMCYSARERLKALVFDQKWIDISLWYPLVRRVGVPCHARWLGGSVLIFSCVTDMSQAIIFSQFPHHSFAGRKLWEARFLKTVNLQLGLARSAGKDRGFLQLVIADEGALVNRSPRSPYRLGQESVSFVSRKLAECTVRPRWFLLRWNDEGEKGVLSDKGRSWKGLLPGIWKILCNDLEPGSRQLSQIIKGWDNSSLDCVLWMGFSWRTFLLIVIIPTSHMSQNPATERSKWASGFFLFITIKPWIHLEISFM